MIRALVIDDDDQTETLLKAYFDRLAPETEAHCTFAKSDAEALEIINSGADFEVALVAIDRESVSGVGLFHQIRDRSFRVPRIALSSGTDISLIRTAMNQGAVDFMVKPMGFDDFKATLLRILETVERRRKNWKDSAAYSALRKEIDIAADIQQRILPTTFPALDGYQLAASMRAARVMGGDFYDMFECDNGDIGFIIADVSGKGVPAAFYMAVARTLLHSAALSVSSPAECLNQVNELLCAHQIPGMFVSVIFARLNPETNAVTFANGGHQLPFKISTGKEPEELEGGDGVVLGVMPEMEYRQITVEMEPASFLFLYTDGVTEAFNEQRQAFGEEKLGMALNQLSGKSGGDIISNISKTLDEFAGNAEQHDDITCLVLRRS